MGLTSRSRLLITNRGPQGAPPGRRNVLQEFVPCVSGCEERCCVSRLIKTLEDSVKCGHVPRRQIGTACG